MKQFVNFTTGFYSLLLTACWALLVGSVLNETFELRWIVGGLFLLYIPFVFYRRVKHEYTKQVHPLILASLYGSLVFGLLSAYLGNNQGYRVLIRLGIALVVNLILLYWIERVNHAKKL